MTHTPVLRRATAVGAVCLIGIGVSIAVSSAQGPQANPPAAGDWPLHSRDVGNTRFSPLAEITPSNASALAVKWTFDLPKGENAGSETPLVVGGVMYFNSGSRLFALEAGTGQQLWTADLGNASKGGGRGPAYGDGRVYFFDPTTVYAADAETGRPVASFGTNGALKVVNKALDFKDPGNYPPDLDPQSLGYSMTTPPTYHNGTLYMGIPFADSLISGGLVIAADARTGALQWVFRAVPQGPQDDGWAIARDTWSGPKRQGGGIWTQPAIDPALGRLYVNISNPTPNYDGSSRKGTNLFTNSVVALDLLTGKLLWHFQAIHHDIWDWDLATGPTLVDVTSRGQTVKALASLGKTCYMYVLNRETGQPLNPMVETPVPTTTDVPGDEPWPTQPIPFTSRGVPQQPFCATYPTVTDPELARRVRPTFHPYQVKELVITSPGNQGGPNYGPSSFSPKTGHLYVTGKNDAYSIRVTPVGDTMTAGPGAKGHFGLLAEVGKTGITSSQNVAAYDPATGQQIWVTELPGVTGTGSFVTAGDVIVQAVGRDFYALDARTGRTLFKTSFQSGTRSTPMTYSARGRQFIAMVSGNTVVALGLP